jgi:hypothetical protein
VDSALPEARALAIQLGDTASKSMLDQMEGTMRVWRGRVHDGVDQLTSSFSSVGMPIDSSLSLLPSLPPTVVMMTSALRIATALGCWLAGRVDEAQWIIDDTRSFVTDRSMPQAQAVTAATSAIVAQLDGDRALTAQLARQAVDLADEVTTRQWKQWGIALRWWAGEGGVEPEIPPAFLRPYFLMLLADRHGSEPTRALSLLDEALDTARVTTEQFCEAAILRVRAGVVAQLGRPEEAHANLDEAIAVARAQGARMLELRALTDRARLLGANPRFLAELATCVSDMDHGGNPNSLKDAREVLDAHL